MEDHEDNMTFVGVDQAQRKTGLCVIRPGCGVELAVLKVKSKGPDRIKEYYERLGEWLDKVGNVTLAALEAGAYDGSGRVFQLGGVSALTQLCFWEREISFLEPVPQYLKMFMTSRSDAPKDWMQDAAEKEMGMRPSDDEADAYALARIAQSFWTEEVRTRKQAQVIVKLREQGRFHEY